MAFWACPEFYFSSRWHRENNLDWASPSSSEISNHTGVAHWQRRWDWQENLMHKDWGRSEIEVRALCGHQGGLLVSLLLWVLWECMWKHARTMFWEWTITWRPTGSGQPAPRRENCRTLHHAEWKGSEFLPYLKLTGQSDSFMLGRRKLLDQRQRTLLLSIAIYMSISIHSSVSPGPWVLWEQ